MGPWYEWVVVKFIFKDGNDSNSKMEQNTQQPLYFDNDEYLSKVFCFFKADRKPEIHAIVQSYEPRHHGHDSILFQQWRKGQIKYQ